MATEGNLGKARETARAGEPGNLPPLSSFRWPGKLAVRNSVVATTLHHTCLAPRSVFSCRCGSRRQRSWSCGRSHPPTAATAHSARRARPRGCWPARRGRRVGAAAADGRIDQRLRRPARARARRSRANSHGKLARGRSRGVVVRDRGVTAYAELRHGRGVAPVRSRRRARRHLHEPVHALAAAARRLSRPRAGARELRRRHRAQLAARSGSRRPSRTRRRA